MVLLYLILALLPPERLQEPNHESQAYTRYRSTIDPKEYREYYKQGKFCVTQVYEEYCMEPFCYKDPVDYIDTSTACYTVERLDNGPNGLRVWIYRGVIWRRIEYWPYGSIKTYHNWHCGPRSGIAKSKEDAVNQMEESK